MDRRRTDGKLGTFLWDCHRCLEDPVRLTAVEVVSECVSARGSDYTVSETTPTRLSNARRVCAVITVNKIAAVDTTRIFCANVYAIRCYLGLILFAACSISLFIFLYYVTDHCHVTNCTFYLFSSQRRCPWKERERRDVIQVSTVLVSEFISRLCRHDVIFILMLTFYWGMGDFRYLPLRFVLLNYNIYYPFLETQFSCILTILL